MSSEFHERLLAKAKEIKAARDDAISERDSMRAQLQERIAELADMTKARDALQAFIDTPDWGEIESGQSISAGSIVRYGALRYSARSTHTKALTRSPLNLIYWEIVTDVG